MIHDCVCTGEKIHMHRRPSIRDSVPICVFAFCVFSFFLSFFVYLSILSCLNTRGNQSLVIGVL